MTYQTHTIDTFMDLDSFQNTRPPKAFVVIHPLHDAPEAKCDADRLGPMRLTPGCRIALVAVRCYLVAILLMGGYRVVTLLSSMKN
jgi:hypothetical protein